MSGGKLGAFLAGERPTLNWLDFEAYARRVFAGEPADWYSDPNRFAATLSQAHAIFRGDVLALDLLAPWLAADASGPMLEDGFALAVAEALRHRFDDSVDLVLSIPCAMDLLASLHGEAPDFDKLDDHYSALIEKLRPWAEGFVSGLLVRFSSLAALNEDEQEAIEPLIASARHYEWAVVACFDADQPSSVPNLPCDLAVFPESAAGSESVAGLLTCGGIPPAYWAGEGAVPASGLRFGRIPDDAEPERVTEQARRLLD